MRWSKPKPNTSMSLFDQNEKKKQEGIEASYQGADSYWKNAVREALVQCAKNYKEFTTNEVWDIVDGLGITTGENRAMGAVMQAASRSGMIRKTGQYKESRRRSQHNQPIAIWKSNIYGVKS